jgi:hypothetical protein
MGLVRTTIDSYEPALATEVNRTSGSLVINAGDLIVITAMVVGAADGVAPAITFTNTWGYTFTALVQHGTDATRVASSFLWWVKASAGATGTYTINVTTTAERNVQVYCERYTSAGTVRQSTSDGGDIDVGGSVPLALASDPLATSELMVIVSYRPLSPFTNDYVVGEAGYSVIHDHVADDNAKGRVLTAAGTAGKAATLAFSPSSGDEFDHAAIMIEVTQGDSTVALVAATVHAGGRPLTSTPGATTTTLNRATVHAGARPAGLAAGTLTVTLGRGTVHAAARVLDATSGFVVAAGRRTLVLSARPVTVTIGSPQTVTLGRRSLVAAARPVTVTRGGTSVVAVKAVTSIEARPVVPALAVVVAVGRRTLHLTPRPVGVVRGTITVAAGRRSLAISARPVTLTKGVSTILAGRRTLHLTARPVTITVTATTRTAVHATLHVQARPLTATRGPIAVQAVRSVRSTVARPLTVTRGPAPTILVVHAVAHVAARPVTVARGPVARTVVRGIVAAVARPVTPKGSGITVTLGRRTLTVTARPVTPVRGLRTVITARAAVHPAARAVTITRGPAVVALAHAVVHVSTGKVDPDVIGWWVSAVGTRRVLPE